MRNRKPLRLAQSGFTLIELIVVIVIIGIMAAVAIPKYNDLTANARTAALQGIGGSIASASATNYALKAGAIKDSGGVALGKTVATCTDALTLVTAPAGYTISTGALANGAAGSCTLTDPDGTTTLVFQAIGAT
jgi:MSHA pilin protein MshA